MVAMVHIKADITCPSHTLTVRPFLPSYIKGLLLAAALNVGNGCKSSNMGVIPRDTGTALSNLDSQVDYHLNSFCAHCSFVTKNLPYTTDEDEGE